uniref:Uncharacterized protein n=1 Tax=Peronospora matthiolae TaxID=2874970 RepID=A0AAV1UXE6_9STRA
MVLALTKKANGVLPKHRKTKNKRSSRGKSTAANDASGKAAAVSSTRDFVSATNDVKLLGEKTGSSTAAQVGISCTTSRCYSSRSHETTRSQWRTGRCCF